MSKVKCKFLAQQHNNNTNFINIVRVQSSLHTEYVSSYRRPSTESEATDLCSGERHV